MLSAHQPWDKLKTCAVGRSYSPELYNYIENPVVVKKLEEYGITPHIFNFRHRYFWDGGIHCITLDLDREGDREDYFPERG